MEKTKITYRNWEIEVDRKLTKKAYSKLKISSSDGCGCAHCPNYSENIEIIFPAEIENLFNALGIDKRKELEISHVTKLKNDLHLYSGWFHFKGKFEEKNCSTPLSSGNGRTLNLEQITDNFEIGFTKKIYNTIFEHKSELVQIEFDCKIPWIINRKLETNF
jgi:hypothetical protein